MNHIPDYADKSWLRPEAPRLRLSHIMAAILVLGFLFATQVLAGSIHARKWSILLLLQPSSKAATLDECERARPDLRRPDAAISRQNGSGSPWHHRTCIWRPA